MPVVLKVSINKQFQHNQDDNEQTPSRVLKKKNSGNFYFKCSLEEGTNNVVGIIYNYICLFL
jgi:hypothetical protein